MYTKFLLQLLAYHDGGYTQAAARPIVLPFHLAPLVPRPRLHLSQYVMLTAAAAFYPELKRNWKIGCFLIFFSPLRKYNSKLSLKFYGKVCYIYSHSIWFSCYRKHLFPKQGKLLLKFKGETQFFYAVVCFLVCLAFLVVLKQDLTV